MGNNRIRLCDLPKLKEVKLEEQCFCFIGRVTVKSGNEPFVRFVDVPTLESEISCHESSFRSVFYLDEENASGFGAIIRRQSPYITNTRESNNASEVIEVSPTMRSFVMNEGSYNLVRELSFDGCVELQTITINPNSFISCLLVRICGLPKLQILRVCSNCFSTLDSNFKQKGELFSDSENEGSGEEYDEEYDMEEDESEEDGMEEDVDEDMDDDANDAEEVDDRYEDSDEMDDWDSEDDYSDDYEDEMDEMDDYKDDDLLQEKEMVHRDNSTLVISDCPKLKEITVQDYCFCRYKSITISRGSFFLLQP